MNILQIHKYHYYRAGAEYVYLNLMDILRQRGHNVAPFSIIHPENLPSPFSKYFLPITDLRTANTWDRVKGIKSFIYNTESPDYLQRLIDDFKPDVAHLHNIFNSFSLSILPVLKRNNIPVVWTVHDCRLICPTLSFDSTAKRCDTCLKTGGIKCGLHRCFENNFAFSWMCAAEMFHKELLFDYNKYIDVYHFPSKHYMDMFSQRHNYFREKGKVIYHYLPVLDSVVPDYIRGKYILYYGRLIEDKGLRVLIDAMKQLPDVQLHIAGDGPMMNELREINLPNVKLLGFLRGDELDRTLRGASSIITPSICEDNNPTAMCGGMVYGKPAILSDKVSDPVSEDIAFTYPHNDSNALANAIRRTLNLSDNEYLTMSRNAREYAETHFHTAQSYSDAFLSIYQDLIKSRR